MKFLIRYGRKAACFLSLILSLQIVTISSLDAQVSQSSGQNVYLMSDGQLNDFWVNAKKLGYNYQTVTKLLQEGGFSYTESLNIVDRIRGIEASTSSDPFSVLSKVSSSGLTADEEKIFGLKLFRQSEFSFQDYNSMTVPGTYVLGIGDGLSVILYGETTDSYSFTIDQQGRIQLPFIGPVSIAGLQFESAKALIKEKLSQRHVGLSYPNPTVFLDITLVNTRSIVVNILGEVIKPGTYALSTTSTIFSAVYKAGGPTTNGTLRNIKIYRSSRLIREFDLYDFISKGFTDQEFVLNDQDVIVLSTYNRRIELEGAIKNPGIYELKNEETINDILNFSGGYTAGADSTSLILKRLNGASQFIREVKPNISLKDLNDGDILEIGKLKDSNIERVEISGAVMRPGFYSWQPEMNLNDLIEMAGGVRSDALQNRATVFRLNEDLSPYVRSVGKGAYEQVNIEKSSSVYIPSKIEITETKFINLSGQLNREGSLPYYEGMTILDAIVLSNGIKSSALGGNIEIVRLKNENGSGEYDYFNIEVPREIENIEEFVLRENDNIYVRDTWVRRKSRSVYVKGDVDQPGEYIISQGNTRVSDLVSRFGGYMPTANLNGLKLYRQVKNVSDENDSIEYERKKSISEFISSAQFEATVSKLEYDEIKNSYGQLQNDRILSNRKNSNEGVRSDSIDVQNNFKLSKQFVINNKVVQLMEIGLSYEDIMSNPESQYNVKLLDGDILFVPSRSSLVEIDGAVFQPTQAIYKKEKSFLDYVETAGGFKRRADKRRAYVEYANGEIARVRSFVFFKFYPKVTTDAIIKVPLKPENQKINFDRVISLITTTISTYLLIEAVSNR
ncbi:SLBB domain-containing protein [Roseivirga sp.]|uniref:SLBB domain-containing protein n=1 Tax=Roseivirga sp. TaxID=1964215 RepID=UPI002B26713F|nr:SLBB domain-containing protein [Roseivirga sp.]